jgi:hypothetical protein
LEVLPEDIPKLGDNVLGFSRQRERARELLAEMYQLLGGDLDLRAEETSAAPEPGGPRMRVVA